MRVVKTFQEKHTFFTLLLHNYCNTIGHRFIFSSDLSLNSAFVLNYVSLFPKQLIHSNFDIPRALPLSISNIFWSLVHKFHLDLICIIFIYKLCSCSECLGEGSSVEIVSEIDSRESRGALEKDCKKDLSRDLPSVSVQRKDVR